jgi:hypothetical protein
MKTLSLNSLLCEGNIALINIARLTPEKWENLKNTQKGSMKYTHTFSQNLSMEAQIHLITYLKTGTHYTTHRVRNKKDSEIGIAGG